MLSELDCLFVFLDQVSYSLLVFFCGMFITVQGFNKTGIPSTMWSLMEPYSKINTASGLAVLSVIILVLSNLASNVPTGMFVLCFSKALYDILVRPNGVTSGVLLFVGSSPSQESLFSSTRVIIHYKGNFALFICRLLELLALIFEYQYTL